jgi:hypothetical protein
MALFAYGRLWSTQAGIKSNRRCRGFRTKLVALTTNFGRGILMMYEYIKPKAVTLHETKHHGGRKI